MNIFILILVGVVGVLIGGWLGRGSVRRKKVFVERTGDELGEMREEAREALSDRTERRKEKILELMRKEVVHQEELGVCELVDRSPGITRLEVEKLLDVSRHTAHKYLNALEKEDKIEQVGCSGKDVYYILK